MSIAHRAMSISYIELNPMYELWSYHDNKMNPMYELWSCHDNGFIIDELCYIISSMTFIMTPTLAATVHQQQQCFAVSVTYTGRNICPYTSFNSGNTSLHTLTPTDTTSQASATTRHASDTTRHAQDVRQCFCESVKHWKWIIGQYSTRWTRTSEKASSRSDR